MAIGNTAKFPWNIFISSFLMMKWEHLSAPLLFHRDFVFLTKRPVFPFSCQKTLITVMVVLRKTPYPRKRKNSANEKCLPTNVAPDFARLQTKKSTILDLISYLVGSSIGSFEKTFKLNFTLPLIYTFILTDFRALWKVFKMSPIFFY